MKYLVFILSFPIVLMSQDVKLYRYAIDAEYTPKIEELVFTKEHEQPIERLVNIQGEHYYWISGYYFGKLDSTHYERVDINLPNYFNVRGGYAYESDPNNEETICNLRLKDEVLSNPYSVDTKDELTLITRSKFELLDTAFKEMDYSQYLKFAKENI